VPISFPVKPIFITFEGIDGCGKSSLTSVVAGRLMEAGFRVDLTAEPTRTWLGDAVRRSYKEDVSPYTEAFLFLADRATHTDWIRKKMTEGRVVISDRYSDSTVAYQAAQLQQKLGGNATEYIRWLTEASKPAILEPDITLLLDVAPEISLKRLGGRSELEKFENLENLKLVRQNYLDIAAKAPRIKIMDASRSMNEVQGDVFKALSKHLRIEF
jgi:dTMP kinase